MNTEERTKLSTDVKWLIGVLLTIMLPILVGAWKVSTDMSALRETSVSTSRTMERLGASLDKVSNSLQTLITEDMTNLRIRISALEVKGILPVLPEAEKRVVELERELHRMKLELSQED